MSGTQFHAGRAAIFLAGVAGSIAIAAWMGGCGSPRKAEPLVGEKRIPNEQVRTGEVAFMRYCHQCHPGGSGGLGPALNNKPLPGGLIRAQVRKGGGAMPAFGKERVSEEELEGIVAYLAWMRGLGANS